MNIKAITFILAFHGLLFFPNFVSGNSMLIQPVDSIFSFIYNKQFEKAEKELNLFQGKSENLDYFILYIDLNWWKSVKKINVHDFTNFKIILSQLEAKIRNSSRKNDLQELILLSYSLRMAAHEDRYLNMIGSFNKINKITEKLDRQQLPEHEKQIYELYKAILGVFKSKVFFYNSPGLRSLSIAILEQNSFSNQTIQKTISNYFLGKIYFELEKTPTKSISYFKKLNQMYPQNTIFSDYIKLCEATR